MTNDLPIIQCLWIGKRLNGLARLSLASFVAQGHPVHLYTYNPVKNVPNGITVMDANDVMPYQHVTINNGYGQGSVGPFSDWFRFQLLYEKGGIWADTDMIAVKPWEQLPDIVISSELIKPTAEAPEAIHANCGVLKFAPGDPLVAHCLQKAKARVAQGQLTWGCIGPKLIEEALSHFPDYRPYVVPPHVFCGVHYWDVTRLIDTRYEWRPNAEVLAVHCWNELWRRNMNELAQSSWLNRWWYWRRPHLTLNVNTRYPRNTLIGQWQAQYC